MNETELTHALRSLRAPPADRGFERRLRSRLEDEAMEIRASRPKVLAFSPRRPRWAAWGLAASLLLGVGVAAAWGQLRHFSRPGATIEPESVARSAPKSVAAKRRAGLTPVANAAAPKATNANETPASPPAPPRHEPRREGRLPAPPHALPRPASPREAVAPPIPPESPGASSELPPQLRLERMDIDPSSRATPVAPELSPDVVRERERSAALDRLREIPGERERDIDEARREEARREEARRDEARRNEARRERGRADDAPGRERSAREPRERGSR